MLFQCKKNTATAGNNNGNAGTTQPANEVWIQNMAFSPAMITVPVNTTIRWRNKDGAAHTVTGTQGAFDSGNIGAGGEYSRQFTSAGTYPYKCSFHASMTGTVVVQ
jgi:plastocyanin